MKIAIDGRMIQPRSMHGIARYVFELVNCLSFMKTPHQFYLIVENNSPLLNKPWPTHITPVETKARWISFREQWMIPRLLSKLGIDLFHSPSFVAPFLCPSKMIMTIHDLNHIMLPQYYTPMHQFYYNTIVRYSTGRSECVLTVSEFSKNEMAKYLGVRPEKVVVTYNGVSENYKPVLDLNFLEYVREIYELPQQFIFCLSNNKPHKNVFQLLSAYVRSNLEIPLVLVGPVDNSLVRYAEKYSKKHQIYFIRFIEEEHLPAVYSMCRLFVYPSGYEGFGLPPLEALACGAPVVVSRSSSLPEVVGENAVFIDPTNIETLARTLESFNKVLENEGNPFREKGIEHSKKFTWLAMAEKTLKLYESCLE
jgi:glycosyltransferase involved in cell wall biosynthesis